MDSKEPLSADAGALPVPVRVLSPEEMSQIKWWLQPWYEEWRTLAKLNPEE